MASVDSHHGEAEPWTDCFPRKERLPDISQAALGNICQLLTARIGLPSTIAPERIFLRKVSIPATRAGEMRGTESPPHLH